MAKRQAGKAQDKPKRSDRSQSITIRWLVTSPDYRTGVQNEESDEGNLQASMDRLLDLQLSPSEFQQYGRTRLARAMQHCLRYDLGEVAEYIEHFEYCLRGAGFDVGLRQKLTYAARMTLTDVDFHNQWDAMWMRDMPPFDLWVDRMLAINSERFLSILPTVGEVTARKILDLLAAYREQGNKKTASVLDPAAEPDTE